MLRLPHNLPGLEDRHEVVCPVRAAPGGVHDDKEKSYKDSRRPYEVGYPARDAFSFVSVHSVGMIAGCVSLTRL